MKKESFASFTGVECFKRFKFVSHLAVIPSDVEEPRCYTLRFAAGSFDFAALRSG